MDNWTIQVNGQPYDLYKSFSFSRSMEQNVGEFTVTIPEKGDYPKINQVVNILCNGQTCLTGYIDKLERPFSIDGGERTFSGKDKLGDVVDSHLPAKVKTDIGNISLLSYAQKVLNALQTGLKAIDRSGDNSGATPTKKIYQITSDPCQSALGLLADMSAKIQCWIISDEESNLLIFRAGLTSSAGELYLKKNGQNNILDSSITNDASQSFNTYVVRSQGGLGYDEDETENEDVHDMKETGTDGDIRKSRYFEVNVREQLDRTQLRQRVSDEINFRRAKSFRYSCITPFFSLNGQIAKLGEKQKIIDEQKNISGQYILADFNVAFDKETGTVVTRTYAEKNAFQIVNWSARDKQLARICGTDDIDLEDN